MSEFVTYLVTGDRPGLLVRPDRQRLRRRPPRHSRGQLRPGLDRRGRRDAVRLAAGRAAAARAGRGGDRRGVRGWSACWSAFMAIGRRGTPPLISLIVTLGVSMLFSAAIIWLWGQDPVSPPGLDGFATILGAEVERQRLLVLGRDAGGVRGTLAVLLPHLRRQGAHRERLEPLRRPYGRHRRTSDGTARLRALRRAGRAGGRAGRAEQRSVLLLRPAAGTQRVRGRRLRRAGQPAAHPGRRPRARRRRPADRGIPQRVLPDRGGPAADAGHHDRAEPAASPTRRPSDVQSDVPRAPSPGPSLVVLACVAALRGPAGADRPDLLHAHGPGGDRGHRAVAADGLRRPGVARPGRVRGRRCAHRRGRHHQVRAAAAGRAARRAARGGGVRGAGRRAPAAAARATTSPSARSLCC